MPAFTELSPSSLPPARLRVKPFDSQMRFSITASRFPAGPTMAAPQAATVHGHDDLSANHTCKNHRRDCVHPNVLHGW